MAAVEKVVHAPLPVAVEDFGYCDRISGPHAPTARLRSADHGRLEPARVRSRIGASTTMTAREEPMACFCKPLLTRLTKLAVQSELTE